MKASWLPLAGLLLLTVGSTLAGCAEAPSPAPPAPETTTAPARADHDGMTPEEMARMGSPAAPADEGVMAIDQRRLQAGGVKFATAQRQVLEQVIRTTGRVEADERRLARVNAKVEAWIERLYVSTTGEAVRRGQPLLTLYSPELVAAQEEYLLALRGVGALGPSAYPDVSSGARSLLEASRRRLQLWDVPDQVMRELERTGQVQKALPLVAPASGTVIEKMAVAGMRVGPGDDLYVIADLSHVWVLADIYEYELAQVRAGQSAVVTLPYDGSREMARLAFIYPTVDRQTRTATVRLELDNADGRLKPAMFVEVGLTVPLGERLVVPRDAVLDSGARRIVFVRHGDGSLAWREVRTGVRAGESVEILAGVAAGEQVVASAGFLIDSESSVKTAMAGMDMSTADGAGQAPADARRPEQR